MPDYAYQCAREIMETVPQIMQAVRVEMRSCRGGNIPIPQFRTLRFLQANPDSSLTELAEHLGLTLPSGSKLIDGMVKQELILRRESSSDRRRVTLALTQSGEAIVNQARSSAQDNLAGLLRQLSDADLQTVERAMLLLQPLFCAKNLDTNNDPGK